MAKRAIDDIARRTLSECRGMDVYVVHLEYSDDYRRDVYVVRQRACKDRSRYGRPIGVWHNRDQVRNTYRKWGSLFYLDYR